MTTPSKPTHSSAVQQRALVWLLVLVTLAFFWVLLPFYGAVLWGTIIAIVFAPVHRRLCRRFKGRENWAALATLGLVLVIAVLPLAIMGTSLVQEGARVVEGVQSGQIDFGAYARQVVEALPGPLQDLLGRFGLSDVAEIQRRAAESFGRASQFFASRVLTFGQSTLDLLIDFSITMYLAFFLLRDGRRLQRGIIARVPLKETDKRVLFDKFTTVIRATVKGNVVVAVTQGALGGLAFWALGIHAALLWGVVMGFLSLLPAVGAGLVWLPVALYLLASGELWQAAALVAFGVLVIGLVDNVLRPILVGKDTKLPDYLVLISTVGGIALIGLNGFVVGPLVAAIFLSVWDLFGQAEGEGGVESMPPAAAEADVTAAPPRTPRP